jgi:hypothetical protein
MRYDIVGDVMQAGRRNESKGLGGLAGGVLGGLISGDD